MPHLACTPPTLELYHISPHRSSSHRPSPPYPPLQVAKCLAGVVVPNEYGIHPAGKLRIGSMICRRASRSSCQQQRAFAAV